MKFQKLSVGLPCYNEEKNINKVINDIIAAIGKNKLTKWELILVDNKSKDKTVEIIKKI